jgi:hypothetical protein
MQDWVEEMFDPIRRRSREANAPLLKKLNVGAAEVERLASCVPARADLASRNLKRAVGIAAIRGATRL